MFPERPRVAISHSVEQKNLNNLSYGTWRLISNVWTPMNFATCDMSQKIDLKMINFEIEQCTTDYNRQSSSFLVIYQSYIIIIYEA